MAWNFANWYVPLIEGCCRGINVPVPYEDGMTFIESNEHIITIVNQLIDNNNEIPEIVKEECKAELILYLDSEEGKQKIEDIVSTLDLPYVSKAGDTVTGDLSFTQTAGLEFLDNNESRNIMSVKKSDTSQTSSLMGLSPTGQLNIRKLAAPYYPQDAANKQYVDDKIDSLGNVLDFKGVKATEAELPTTGNSVGDVWYVEATKSAWAWVIDSADPTGRWDEFGPVIDLSPYFKKADIVQTTGTNTTKVMSQDATTNAINANSYTLPIANANDIGGVKGPVKTTNETEQVHIDAQGKMWVKPGGTSVNVVQTTGTSEADVMSQKAVTNTFIPNTGSDVLTGRYRITDDNPSTKRVDITGRGITFFEQLGDQSIYEESITIDSTGLRISGEPGYDKVIDVEDKRIVNISDPTNLQDAATKNYVDSHSSTYTLPIANETRLGGVIAPAKTVNETEQVRIDAQGKMWVKPSSTSVNPSTTTPKMDGAATVGIETTYARGDHIHPKDTSKVDVEVGKGLSTNDYTTADKDKLAGIAVNANNYTLPAATANALGGVIADPSNQAMPVEIAIDPTTHKLKGSLMTAYNSPSTIGGVVSNGIKTDEDTVPVHMDSDGKQWVKAGGSSTVPIATATTIGGILKNGDKTANEKQPVVMDNDGKQWVKSLITSETKGINENTYTYFKTNKHWYISFDAPGSTLIDISFKTSKDNSKFNYQKLITEIENNDYEITNIRYVNKHLAGKFIDAPTAAGQIPKYNGTKVIWEAPAAAATPANDIITGKKAFQASTDTIIIPSQGKENIVATLLGAEGGTDLWIANTVKAPDTGDFTIKLNAATTITPLVSVCYLLF